MADIYLLQGTPGANGDKGPVGDAGPAGNQGTAGTNGTNGTAGATGVTGGTGPTGPTGPAGATGAAGNFSAISLLDTTFTPVALYQLNEVLTDSSGNAHTLTSAGPLWSEVYPGVRGLYPPSSGVIEVANADAALRVAGDLTVAAVIYVRNAAVGGGIILSYSGDGSDDSSAASNFQYRLSASAQTLSWLSEHGASGLNDAYNITFQLPIRQTSLIAVTRVSNVIQFYMNGKAVGAASSALTTPDGGTSGRLTIGNGWGGGGSANFYGTIASACIIASGLTATQMKSMYNNSLGARLPQQP